jgi:hypothetical protein
MTTGIYLGSYPDPRFCFTRSYAEFIEVIGDTNDVDVSDNTYIMWIDRSIGYGITYVLNDYIKPWSSNGYTLDHVVYDCWWHAFFDSVHHPQPYTVNFWGRGSNNASTISIIQPAAGTASFVETLPPAPPGYWLANPDLINFS